MTINANAQLLADTLKSGAYKQGSGALRTSYARPDPKIQLLEQGYCCLGVACDLFRKETGIGFWKQVNSNKPAPYSLPPELYWTSNWQFVTPDGGAYQSYLPPLVQQWLGFETEKGYFNSPNRLASLVAMNDRGQSFEDIAAAIESEPGGLFAS